jgi:hypothetical protein
MPVNNIWSYIEVALLILQQTVYIMLDCFNEKLLGMMDKSDQCLIFP